MVDLDSDPTKLIDIVTIGKQLLITRGRSPRSRSPTTWPSTSPSCRPCSAAWPRGPQPDEPAQPSLGDPLGDGVQRPDHPRPGAPGPAGVAFRPASAEQLLRRNLLLYGLGGLVVPFVGIKAIDRPSRPFSHSEVAAMSLSRPLFWDSPADLRRRCGGNAVFRPFHPPLQSGALALPVERHRGALRLTHRRHDPTGEVLMTLLRACFRTLCLTAGLWLLTVVLYPLPQLLVGQGLFPSQANGSLLSVNGTVVGSALIGQPSPARAISRAAPAPWTTAPARLPQLQPQQPGPTNPALASASPPRPLISATSACSPLPLICCMPRAPASIPTSPPRRRGSRSPGWPRP